MYSFPRIAGSLCIAWLLAAISWLIIQASSHGFATSADLYARALYRDYAGLDSEPLLETITQTNPRYSAAWIRLGLLEEMRGNLNEAERLLLHAASIDRQHEPRWTLANFYFRRDRPDEFWTWARRAAEMSYGDRRALFDLCRKVSDDPAEIFARAIPDQPELVEAWVAYLLAENSVAGLAESARKLPAGNELRESAIDRLLSSGDSVNAWNLAGSPPRPYRRPWHAAGTPGTRIAPPIAQDELRVVLDGNQPEQCELVAQFAILEAGRVYTLRWESSAPTRGLAWVAAGETSPIEPSEDWRSGSMNFTPPSDIAHISLVYRRPSGSPRMEGSAGIRGIALEPR